MKIGLVAMSGIRCYDAELMNLGLTLPGFVERSKTIASLPSLGLLTLAGMTPPEHEVRYLEIPDIRVAGTLTDGFDLVGISSYSAQIDEAYELADDNSFVNRAYWMELLPEIAKRHIRWFTETDISLGEDGELLALLRKNGCAEVLVGLESPVPAGLDGVETRGNWKMKHLPRYREGAARNPGARHPGERLLCPGAGWAGAGDLRPGARFRAGRRSLRRPDHPADAVSGNAAVYAPRGGRPAPGGRGLEALHALRPELPP